MSRQSTTSGLNSPRGGSLSSAVSSLVRAQYGLTSQSDSGASNTDLDKHVAELLLQEAREREARSKASNSATAWSFSDEEDGSGGKQFKTKTNKRFLKNILKGVEDHNAPLRRKENDASLEEIRQRERKAREIRLGMKDSERNRRDAASTSSSTASGRSAGPGFAARMLANGLSGALNAREDRTREDRQIKNAIEDARKRAEDDRDIADRSTSRRNTERDYKDNKGKQKEELRDGHDYEEKEERDRRRHRSRSRERNQEDHRSSRHCSNSRRDPLEEYSDSDERERKRTRR